MTDHQAKLWWLRHSWHEHRDRVDVQRLFPRAWGRAQIWNKIIDAVPGWLSKRVAKHFRVWACRHVHKVALQEMKDYGLI